MRIRELEDTVAQLQDMLKVSDMQMVGTVYSRCVGFLKE